MVLIKIKDILESQRPRERFINNGAKSLSNQELLAIILRNGTKKESSLDIANKVIQKYPYLSDLYSCDIYSLMKIDGIKKAKAIEILAIFELYKRLKDETKKKDYYISDKEKAYEIVKNDLCDEKQENFVVLFLNLRLKLIKIEYLFKGGDTCSIVDINLIFRKAIEYGSKKIVCIHNHPSGDVTPSREDMELTRKIYRIGDIMNIQLIDHLIVGKDNYSSIFSEIKDIYKGLNKKDI